MARKPQELSIFKIASETGFSITTVSRVLHKRPGISEDVRRKIEAEMERVGFTPNYPSPKTRTMALVIPYEIVSKGGTDYFSRMICSVSRASEEHGINTCVIFQRVDERKTLLGKLRRQQACGALFVNGGLLREQIAELHGSRLPFICLDGRLDLEDVGYVDNDAQGGIEEAVEHLFRLGHRRIAFIYNMPQLSNHADRRDYYVQAMTSRGLAPLVREFAPDSEYASIKNALMEVIGEKATAILTVNDDCALKVLRGCSEERISVSGDVSVIGFDNNPSSRHFIPSLTTIDHPSEEICEEGVLHLVRLAGREGNRTLPRVELKTHLVLRDSTGPCRVPIP